MHAPFTWEMHSFQWLSSKGKQKGEDPGKMADDYRLALHHITGQRWNQILPVQYSFICVMSPASHIEFHVTVIIVRQALAVESEFPMHTEPLCGATLIGDEYAHTDSWLWLTRIVAQYVRMFHTVCHNSNVKIFNLFVWGWRRELVYISLLLYSQEYIRAYGNKYNIIGGYEAEEIHVQGPDLTEVQVMMTITLWAIH